MRKAGSRIAVTLTLVAMARSVSSAQNRRSIGSGAPRIQRAAPADATTLATRQRLLEMFARAYFPGRTGQLLIVPREGDFITRPDVAYMHGSPWNYDVAIPLMFVGPAVRAGTYSTPAAQQDVAPTLAAALGVRMPPTTTGRVLPVLRTGLARPRVVMLLVLDGMRRDYFDRYAASIPTLTALRRRSAWFTQARVNYLPTNTAVGHSTISTGAATRARNHGSQRVRAPAAPSPRLFRRRNAARPHGIDAGRRLATGDGCSRDYIGAGQHRPSGDTARRARSVSVEWSARRSRKLRAGHGQLDH